MTYITPILVIIFNVKPPGFTASPLIRGIGGRVDLFNLPNEVRGGNPKDWGK